VACLGVRRLRVLSGRLEQGQVTANRRIFYHFTFSPPKSVSLAALLGNDERILAAHTRAVRSAWSEFEAFSGTRVRVGGAQHDRSTGNFPAALFTHDTSRAVDPHLHTHCIVFNQKVHRAEVGTKGKLAGIVSAGVMVEVDRKLITAQNRLLGGIDGSAWCSPPTRSSSGAIPSAGSRRPRSAWNCRAWPASPPATGAWWLMDSRECAC
jgi:hypothetical protein